MFKKLFGGGRGSGRPGTADVLARARILGAAATHCVAWPPPEMTGEFMANWSQEDREQLVRKHDEASEKVRHYLQNNKLWQLATHEEWAFFNARLLDRTPQQYADAAWGLESVCCCLWALGLIPEVPPYDKPTAPEVTKKLSKEVSAESVALRAEETLGEARETAQLWHWRARTRQLAEEGRLPDQVAGHSMEEVIAVTAAGAAEEGVIPPVIGRDFPAFEKPYRDLTPEEFSTAMSIAMERHKAFNWICGMAPKNRWDETPTDT